MNREPEKTEKFITDPLISVVIPVYNVEKYLRRCLDSVIGNTYRALEIICVNDGSTDGSAAILREYAAQDDRIRIVEKPNGGLPSARRAGMEQATGDFIAHIDSDDWVHRQYFALLVHAWRVTGCDADVIVGGELVTRRMIPDLPCNVASQRIRCFGWDRIRRDEHLCSYAWGRMYTRSLVENLHMPEEISILEDNLFNLFGMGRKPDLKLVAVEGQPLYYYFVREDSLTGRMTPDAYWPAVVYLCEHAGDNPEGIPRRTVYELGLRRLLKQRADCARQDREHPELRADYERYFRMAYEPLARDPSMSRLALAGYRLRWHVPFTYWIFRGMDRLNQDFGSLTRLRWRIRLNRAAAKWENTVLRQESR